MTLVITYLVVQYLAIFLLLTWHCEKNKNWLRNTIIFGVVGIGLGVFMDLTINPPYIGFYIMMLYLFFVHWRLLALPFTEFLFYYTAAIWIQDATYNFYMIFEGGLCADWPAVAVQGVHILIFAVVYFLLYQFLIKRWIQKEGDFYIQKNTVIFSMVILILYQIFQGFIIFDPSFSWANLELRIYSVTVCALLISIQFGMFYSNHLRKDKETVELILNTERKQHEMTKENVDLINRKCHDLKQQIAAVRYMVNDEDQEQELGEVENAITFCDSMFQTGSTALDAILGEKKLVCEENKIRLTFMGDGHLLDWMKDVDIYTIFGNALDNAVEYLKSVNDEGKRFIEMQIKKRANMTVVHIENFCDRQLTFKNGLPETTKDNKQYHGFGLHSIQLITEQYGGTMQISQKQQRFILNLTFPVYENS